jgi:phosphoglycolate phosphatase
MRYRAIIFDLDGTLLDTLADIGDAVNRVLAANGYPQHPEASFRYFVGDGARMLIRRALPEGERSETIIDNCLAAFIDDYALNWNIKTKPYDGIPEMLSELAKSGVKLAVLSNKPHPMVVKCVETFLKAWEFQAVLGQSDRYPKKPDPSSALAIARKMATTPADTLYLGDTRTDMQTAQAAKMFAVGAGWGFRPHAELIESGCRCLAPKPLDVVDCLKSRDNARR